MITHQIEKRYLSLLFFIFGFGIMAWVPRFPDLKENLGLSNGAFGSIITTGAIGAFTGLLTAGHIVHKVGVKKVFISATIFLYLSLALAVQVHSSAIFIIFNILIGFGITCISRSEAIGFQLCVGISISFLPSYLSACGTEPIGHMLHSALCMERTEFSDV